MGWIGLILLLLALALMLTSGWPTYAVLLGVCSFGAVLGLSLGAFDAALLGSLPGRVIGLLEHDLLQALALYALVGALLEHLVLADSLYGGLNRLLGRVLPGTAPALAGLTLGALMAPMNGSVGASLLTLSRTVDRQWKAAGMAAPRRAALVALASTLGVVVPPSLVLLLLGDAMMRAHTEGLNLARELALPAAGVGRIVNTQDVLQAALLPASLVLAGWLLLTALLARSERSTGATEWTSRQRWTLLLVPTLITAMLVGVASGRLRAVEAAASAGMLLLLWGLASRQLRWPLLRRALDDAMSLTGALFALLLAATTFSLLLRAFGTDRLVGQAMLALQGHPLLALGAVLSTLLACAFVLDAFELIFLVVPIVMPPLLAQVDDAAWVATLVLLVLQAGFLLPPVGYAVVLARGQVRPRPAVGALARALWPYLAWAGAVLLLVVAWPQSTKWLRSDSTTSSAPILDPGDVERLMREMSAPIRP